MAKRRAATPAGVKASATPAKLPAKATKVRIREPESKVDAKTESKVDAKKTTPAAARPESKVDAKKTTPAAARPESKVNAQKTTPAAARPKMPAKAVADPSMRQLLFTSALISASSWDYFASPPSNSLKGKIVPHFVNRYSKRRKVSIEVHQVTPSSTAAPTKKRGKKEEEVHSYEECVVRILVPADKQKAKEARKLGLSRVRDAKGSNAASISGMKEIMEADGVSVGDDDESTAGAVSALADTGGQDFDGWTARYRIACRDITIKHHSKKTVFVIVQIQKLRQERELLFDTVEEAQAFCDTLKTERKKEAGRLEVRLKASLGGVKLPPMETITLLVEIVSAWDIPVGDFSTSDPYVVALLGRKEVHRTQVLDNTLDPVWTLKNGSLFLMTVESKELFLSEGLTFLIKDYDLVGRNESLGLIVVSPQDLYAGKGERMEFKLEPPPGSNKKEVDGYMAIRVRHATEYDKKFIEGYKQSLRAASAPEHPRSVNSDLRSIVTRKYKTDKTGTKQYKIRPRPDPKRLEDREWMPDEAIQAECMKDSEHWVDAGNGRIGRLYFEVLGCDGLPNLDAGGFLGNKTDAFVSLVFEDCYVRTDTINDCLSPRWLPWTQRAFIFNIYHPSSQLLLGVFDHDSGFDDHDLIGRVSIDITNLRKDTEYLLSYNIYPSARVSGREVQGQVTVRLRIEMEDERKLALATLEPPPLASVNVRNGKDFRVVRGTVYGKTDTARYSIKTIKSYVDELSEYQRVLFHVEDGIMALLLWRGHFPVKIGSTTIKLPIHSLNAFLVAITLVENPQLYPSFCFASIAWLLLATMGARRNTANVWGRSKSYGEIMQQLIFGEITTPPPSYEPFHDYEQAKDEMEKWVRRIEESEKRAEREYLEAEKLEEERLKEIEEIGDTDADISTKVGGGITLDPIKAALFPVQQLVGVVCRKLRFVKNIIIWEESYFSFWIANGCMILAVASLFVPWFWLILWTSRVVAWVLFGPLMKLVDIFYVSTLKPETEDEIARRKMQERLKRRLLTTEAAERARIIREDAAKMKVMKQFMFGKFGMHIPLLKEDRYVDRPLPQSSAMPHKTKALTLAELAMQEAGYNRTRLPGQNLFGDMIPSVESRSFTSAPVGKATANPDLLDKNVPGGGRNKGSDSTTAAYAKIVSAVAVAGVVSWFSVPLLAAFTASILEMIASRKTS